MIFFARLKRSPCDVRNRDWGLLNEQFCGANTPRRKCTSECVGSSLCDLFAELKHRQNENVVLLPANWIASARASAQVRGFLDHPPPCVLARRKRSAHAHSCVSMEVCRF